MTSIISSSITKLYHIRKNDLESILKELPENTHLNVDTIKNNNINWDADIVLEKYGIDTLFELTTYLQANKSIKPLMEATKGSTSQYEASYKLKEYLLDADYEQGDEIGGESDLIPSILGTFSSDDFNTEDMIFNEETGEIISTDTVLDLITPGVFHNLKANVITTEAWGVNMLDEVTIPYEDTVLSAFMEKVPGENTHGIITIVDPDGTFSGNADFNIDYENDTVQFSGAIIPAILEYPIILDNYVVTLRVFNDEETIKIVKPSGGEIEVPRKYVVMWMCDEGTHFHGIDAEDVSLAHSTDPCTLELMVPEEGVDFMDVPCIEVSYG